MSCELVELLAPGVTIQLGRIRWQARFSHRVLLKLEELSGLDVMAGKVNPWRPSTRVLRALLVASYGSFSRLRPSRRSFCAFRRLGESPCPSQTHPEEKRAGMVQVLGW
jgi:hypothetical protein